MDVLGFEKSVDRIHEKAEAEARRVQRFKARRLRPRVAPTSIASVLAGITATLTLLGMSPLVVGTVGAWETETALPPFAHLFAFLSGMSAISIATFSAVAGMTLSRRFRTRRFELKMMVARVGLQPVLASLTMQLITLILVGVWQPRVPDEAILLWRSLCTLWTLFNVILVGSLVWSLLRSLDSEHVQRSNLLRFVRVDWAAELEQCVVDATLASALKFSGELAWRRMRHSAVGALGDVSVDVLPYIHVDETRTESSDAQREVTCKFAVADFRPWRFADSLVRLCGLGWLEVPRIQNDVAIFADIRAYDRSLGAPTRLVLVVRVDGRNSEWEEGLHRLKSSFVEVPNSGQLATRLEDLWLGVVDDASDGRDPVERARALSWASATLLSRARADPSGMLTVASVRFCAATSNATSYALETLVVGSGLEGPRHFRGVVGQVLSMSAEIVACDKVSAARIQYAPFHAIRSAIDAGALLHEPSRSALLVELLAARARARLGLWSRFNSQQSSRVPLSETQLLDWAKCDLECAWAVLELACTRIHSTVELAAVGVGDAIRFWGQASRGAVLLELGWDRDCVALRVAYAALGHLAVGDDGAGIQLQEAALRMLELPPLNQGQVISAVLDGVSCRGWGDTNCELTKLVNRLGKRLKHEIRVFAMVPQVERDLLIESFSSLLKKVDESTDGEVDEAILSALERLEIDELEDRVGEMIEWMCGLESES